jgi:hypothetical protein
MSAAAVVVTVRRVYGMPVIYPACEQSRSFAKLAGTKTLTPAALRQIAALGYEIKEQPADTVKDLIK